MYKPVYSSRAMFNFSTVFFVTILCAAPWNYKSKDTVMKRYHPILVMIHWVMLVLIFMAWTSGKFVLEHTPNSDLGKIDALRVRS